MKYNLEKKWRCLGDLKIWKRFCLNCHACRNITRLNIRESSEDCPFQCSKWAGICRYTIPKLFPWILYQQSNVLYPFPFFLTAYLAFKKYTGTYRFRFRALVRFRNTDLLIELVWRPILCDMKWLHCFHWDLLCVLCDDWFLVPALLVPKVVKLAGFCCWEYPIHSACWYNRNRKMSVVTIACRVPIVVALCIATTQRQKMLTDTTIATDCKQRSGIRWLVVSGSGIREQLISNHLYLEWLWLDVKRRQNKSKPRKFSEVETQEHGVKEGETAKGRINTWGSLVGVTALETSPPPPPHSLLPFGLCQPTLGGCGECRHSCKSNGQKTVEEHRIRHA
jgi:hypothetical protein